MRHDWIFDVLSDMYAYAEGNGLPCLKAKIEETLIVARREVASDQADTLGNDGLRFRSARRAH
ncbi:MAG: hypothetical protein MUE52_09655 [Tabrizicola sp.]|jgi:hypothetical protein|nr:hypothetical protein [Tabrizicola sp.]